MYQTDRTKQSITIEGEVFYPSDFVGKEKPLFASKSDFHAELFTFLKNWFSDEVTIGVKTSGSTGTPKEMLVEKARMMQSAVLTCSFLNLQANNSALLCMPMQYIAGKMVVVRALVAGLNLYPVAPCGNPLKEVDVKLNFAAMIPLQVYNSLQVQVEKEKLQNIENLIIGGGAIDAQMQENVRTFPNKVFSTYGMTETLSHIALRKLNGSYASDNYTPFDNVTLSLSEDNALIIDASLVSSERLYTNDIAEIDTDGSFRIIGRKDNIVNSGGVKIQIEEVEKLIKQYINTPFAISSLSDSKFGEILVLVVEKDIETSFIDELQPLYYRPKRIIKVDKIPLTETSKIDRASLKTLISTQSFI